MPVTATKTRPGEWVVAILGGLALAAVLVWVLRGGETTPVVVAPLAVPVAAPVAAPVVVAPAPPAAAVADGGEYMLRGVRARAGGGGSAIIEGTDGKQRVVREGRDVGPGVRLETVSRDGVVLMRGGVRQVLGFADGAAAAIPVAERAVAEGVGARTNGVAATANDYRLGLKPRKVAGRTTGFVVADAARLPILQRAGMKPGDVLVSVNGNGIFSEEKLIELPQEIAGASAIEVVFERGGQQQRAVVLPEKR